MLTKEQKLRLIDHLDSKWEGVSCSVCKAHDWAIHGPVMLTTSDEFVAKTVLPMAALLCRVCGNTLFFNLLVAGVEVK